MDAREGEGLAVSVSRGNRGAGEKVRGGGGGEKEEGKERA